MIQRAAFRTLQTQDPQVVKKYMEVLTFQINYHKLETKIRALHDAASGGQFSDRQRDDYERTDRLLTECMLYAESQSGRLYSKQYQWSPALKGAVQAHQFWQMCLKRRKGIKISETKLATLAKVTKINYDIHKLTLLQIIKGWRESKNMLKLLQKEHVQLHLTHLESLAEAGSKGDGKTFQCSPWVIR
jgi:hypothetical protein